MASRHCIFASPAQQVSRSMRARQCKRRKRLSESASSLSTSCSEVAREVQPETQRSLSFKSGRSGSKIGPYSQLGQSAGSRSAGRRRSGNSRRVDRRGDQCTVRVAAAAGALIRGNGFGSLQKTVQIASDRSSKGLHPRLRPRERACWSGRPGPAACAAWRMHNNCLPAARCIPATLLGKIDNPQFAPLRVHIDPEKSGLSRAWLCSMAQVEPLEATGS